LRWRRHRELDFELFAKLRFQGKFPPGIRQPPLAVLPLGTGNDLSQSLGWGMGCGNPRKEIPARIKLAENAPTTLLDQWDLVLVPNRPLPENHKLNQLGTHPQLVTSEESKRVIRRQLERARFVPEDAMDEEGGAPTAEELDMMARIREACDEGSSIYHGSFQNYFSLGIDAKVTVAFERIRQTSCGQCTFKLGLGRLWYLFLGATRTGRCCLRSLANEVNLYYAHRLRPSTSACGGVGSGSESGRSGPGGGPGSNTTSLGARILEQLNLQRRYIQSRVTPGLLRSLVFLNINSYSGGSRPYCRDMGKQRPHDGLLEVLGARNGYTLGCAATFNTGLESLTKGRSFVFSSDSDQFMQSDGEGWYLDSGFVCLIQKARTALMLRAPEGAPFWSSSTSGHRPTFWPNVVAPKTKELKEPSKEPSLSLELNHSCD